MANARTSTTPAPALPSEAALGQLAATLRGSLIRPSDPGYDERRCVWNGMIDRRPGIIARCTGTADVIAAVRFARAHDVPIAVRSGGHNVSGSAVCDDGMVIDLSEMRAVRVDPARSVVRVQGGARLGDIDHEAQALGLAVPVGVVSATGIGGLALHGGMGFLTRKLGLTSDQLVGADIVTADGTLLVVDERNHPDLLWALRGGGGSFGVVTSFEFRAHPIGPEAWLGLVLYPVADSRRVLGAFQELMARAPDDLMAIAIYWSAPHEEFVPKQHHGDQVVVIGACWSGPMDQGERAIQPLRTLATPIADASGPMPYLALQKLFDPEYPNGRRYYWKSIYLENLGDDVIALLDRYAATRPSPITSIDVWALGGQFSRVKPTDTAFYRREAPYLLGIEANWDDPAADQANVAWVRRLYEEAKGHSRGGAYLNFPGFVEEGDALLKESFGANYDRLRRVKAQYDPENRFGNTLNAR